MGEIHQRGKALGHTLDKRSDPPDTGVTEQTSKLFYWAGASMLSSSDDLQDSEGGHFLGHLL